jgi:hypothetical protein
MKKTTKTLIGVVSLAVIILIIAVFTTPTSTPTPSQDLTGDASLTLVSPFGGTVELGQRQNVKWTSFNYLPKTVGIHIIRQIAVNPSRYELVRTVSAATLNDGNGVWVPAQMDLGNNVYVEVTCAVSDLACTASQSVASLAVLDSGNFSNTAAAYQAIEAEENN